MTEPHEFIVMLQISTTDPRLSEQALDAMLSSDDAGQFARVRSAVLQHLPKSVRRLVAVFPIEHARLLMQLHEAVGDDIAALLRQHGEEAPDQTFVRPPFDYVPPTNE